MKPAQAPSTAGAESFSGAALEAVSALAEEFPLIASAAATLTLTDMARD